jgi:hypothetical protein
LSAACSLPSCVALAWDIVLCSFDGDLSLLSTEAHALLCPISGSEESRDGTIFE